jgi:hypothetical protein
MNPEERRAWEKEGNQIKARPCAECGHFQRDCEEIGNWPHCWIPTGALAVEDERQ